MVCFWIVRMCVVRCLLYQCLWHVSYSVRTAHMNTLKRRYMYVCMYVCMYLLPHSSWLSHCVPNWTHHFVTSFKTHGSVGNHSCGSLLEKVWIFPWGVVPYYRSYELSEYSHMGDRKSPPYSLEEYYKWKTREDCVYYI
jgi:hypothetical protein